MVANLKGKLPKLIDEIIEVAEYINQKGWGEGNGGNFSARLEDKVELWLDKENLEVFCRINLNKKFDRLQGKYLLIKGAGKRLRDIKKESEKTLCIGQIIEDKFQIIWPDNCNFKPTSELNSHLSIHELNLENNKENIIVLHTHPTELIALSILKEIQDVKSLNSILGGVTPSLAIYFPEGLGYVPFEIPSSIKLANKTVKAFKKHKIVLWEKHGVIATGKSLLNCFDLIDIANKSAKIYLQAYPNPMKLLSEKKKREIINYFK